MREWALGPIWVKAHPPAHLPTNPHCRKHQMAPVLPLGKEGPEKQWRIGCQVPTPWTVHPIAHLHHELQALGGHVPPKDAPQQILKGVHGVQVQELEGGKEVPAHQ